MRVARHWIRESVEVVDAAGEKHIGVAWGWSADNVGEARRRAGESAARVAKWLAAGFAAPAPPPSGHYLYALDRPPREEIVQELHDAAGGVAALITRNVYGSLVLNCRDLMFIDVDFQPPSLAAEVGGLFRRLFGKKSAPLSASESEVAAFDRIRDWCAAHPETGVRLYRTAAGFRVAITDRPMQAKSDAARTILADFGADPLYCRLCDVQECFRARLTPKPWRMPLELPPTRFPFADANAEKLYRAWQSEYDAAAPGFATCRLVETFGPQEVHADFASLLKMHDALTSCSSELPLA